jgi:hypothetical protein
MIKYVYVVRRKPEVSEEAFRKFWNSDEFKQRISRVATLIGGFNIETSLVLDIDFNQQLNAMRGVEEPLFDAIMEYVLLDAKNLGDILASDEFQAEFKALETLQAEFIDFHHSQRFFVECNEPLVDIAGD